MQISLSQVNGVHFRAETGSGHAIDIDGAPEIGGENRGARPMEMVLVGLAGCTALDVVSILRKSRQKVSDCRIQVDAERSSEVPKVFTRIHIRSESLVKTCGPAPSNARSTCPRINIVP